MAKTNRSRIDEGLDLLRQAPAPFVTPHEDNPPYPDEMACASCSLVHREIVSAFPLRVLQVAFPWDETAR